MNVKQGFQIFQFLFFFFFSLFMVGSSYSGVCLDQGVLLFSDSRIPGKLFKGLNSDSRSLSQILGLEERTLKFYGFKNYQSSDLKHAARVFRWVRRKERLLTKSKEFQIKYLDALKRILEEKYVISEERIPESYFLEQERLVKERGGDLREIRTEIGRRRLIENLLGDQRSSLHAWVDYLTMDSATARFPAWVKLWVMEGVLKVGPYDTETKKFGKRTLHQTAPFPEINREALALVMDDILLKADLLRLKSLGDLKRGESKIRLRESGAADQSESYIDALLNGNFRKLYEKSLNRVNRMRGDLSITKGKWIRYPRGSDPHELTSALNGRGTGWCTASFNTAKSQLSDGDFHLYFSHNVEGEPTIPRIAIRMEGDQIAEIRGIGKAQNMDSDIAKTNILEEKLKDFGEDGKKYFRRIAQSKKLSDIEQKTQADLPLTLEELRFLYEIDQKIESFGYQEDPRIEDILKQRDARIDLGMIFQLEPHEISMSISEMARNKGVKLHHGNINYRDCSRRCGSKFPEIFIGNLDLEEYYSSENLELPKIMMGRLDLESLHSIDDLELPDVIHESFLIGIREIDPEKRFKLPDEIWGNIVFPYLASAKGLELPEKIRGGLYLSSLLSLEGLRLPDHIGGTLVFRQVTSAEGFVLPRRIEGGLYLTNLKTAEGLGFPIYVGENLILNELSSTKGLKLPDVVGDDLYLRSLDSIDDLELSKKVGGHVYLNEEFKTHPKIQKWKDEGYKFVFES